MIDLPHLDLAFDLVSTAITLMRTAIAQLRDIRWVSRPRPRIEFRQAVPAEIFNARMSPVRLLEALTPTGGTPVVLRARRHRQHRLMISDQAGLVLLLGPSWLADIERLPRG